MSSNADKCEHIGDPKLRAVMLTQMAVVDEVAGALIAQSPPLALLPIGRVRASVAPAMPPVLSVAAFGLIFDKAAATVTSRFKVTHADEDDEDDEDEEGPEEVSYIPKNSQASAKGEDRGSERKEDAECGGKEETQEEVGEKKEGALKDDVDSKNEEDHSVDEVRIVSVHEEGGAGKKKKKTKKPPPPPIAPPSEPVSVTYDPLLRLLQWRKKRSSRENQQHQHQETNDDEEKEE
jgi:hypothetical protein